MNPRIKLEDQIKLYAQRPTQENACAMVVIAGEILKLRDRAALGPAIAAITVAAPQCGVRFWAAVLRLVYRIFFHDIPGWNDYWMCTWMLTKSAESLKEIAARTHRNDIVGSTARWMVGSVCQQDPEFARAVKESAYPFWEPTREPQ